MSVGEIFLRIIIIHINIYMSKDLVCQNITLYNFKMYFKMKYCLKRTLLE